MMTSDGEPTERYSFRPAFFSKDAYEQQHIYLEMMHSEVDMLREQVRALQETLLYQAQQQHQANQEIRAVHEESALMNQENQNLVRVNQLTFEEAQEFAQALVAKKTPARDALARLLSVIYGRTVDRTDLDKTQLSACQTHSKRSQQFPPPTKYSAHPMEPTQEQMDR